MESIRGVVVKRMPDKVNHREAKKFLQDVQPFLAADRPQLVFDLSQVKQMDAAGVEMLLHCMAGAMKRDGDVKLAAVSPEASAILEMTRTERLFEIYNTSTDAVRSFTRYIPEAMKQPRVAA